MTLLGFTNYSKNLYAVFSTIVSPYRKFSDFLGFIVFMGVVYMNLIVSRPVETEIGNLFFSTDYDYDKPLFSKMHLFLLNCHLISLLLVIIQLILQFISWYNQANYDNQTSKTKKELNEKKTN